MPPPVQLLDRASQVQRQSHHLREAEELGERELEAEGEAVGRRPGAGIARGTPLAPVESVDRYRDGVIDLTDDTDAGPHVAADDEDPRDTSVASEEIRNLNGDQVFEIVDKLWADLQASEALARRVSLALHQ
ncbi:hypothetical protein B0A48_16073 [Cryoendolithus antarcticus]|uniref:Uncharacterized protein n=1 Tax=Cryoendolithus antarcticus TaxID=1507870 RepID=A0A1V8SF25_9PEZI|nr:hypothetical protein B0A48_16073 [Cryoendolithus antarcticus]